MKKTAAPISLLLFLALLSAAGCSQFPALKSSEGWIHLAQPPQDAEEILAVASQKLRAAYGNPGVETTWFQNPDGRYLIYVRIKSLYEDFDEDGRCSDDTYQFKRSNGVWVQQPDGPHGWICVD